ncbi:hypothetical protein R9C00_11475 [Flammeovirgaceae bacterium SG7u.111]|nr:hypothetical protein [Flammeovirgaceae bacterium SG7u.132]WPO38072.1 hypothetical protein R9C00_11475 [Flammeovirgaceae bacterium SG7u.111]
MWKFVFFVSCFLLFSCDKKSDNGKRQVKEEKVGVSIGTSNQKPAYWEVNGKATLLVGGGFVKKFSSPVVLESDLDSLVNMGCNFVTLSLGEKDFGGEKPFQVSDTGKYNLDAWNERYWHWFEYFLFQCSERGIVVQLEIWPEDFTEWGKSPFNPRNTINFTEEESNLISGFHLQGESPESQKVKAYLEQYVLKLLNITLKSQNVIFTVGNGNSSIEIWESHWESFIRHNSQDNFHEAFVDGTDFIDVSQLGKENGEQHYLAILEVKEKLENVKPINASAIYGGIDLNEWGGIEDGPERFWKNIFAGTAAVHFHKEPLGAGVNDLARFNIASLRSLEDKFPIISSQPKNELLLERSPNEAFCLSANEHLYALYYPGCGQVKLDLQGYEGKVAVSWLNLLDNVWDAEFIMQTEEGKIELRSPCESKWVVVVQPTVEQ